MHTFSLSVLEKAWEFLGWFEHAETIQYFAGSTQPLCLSHLTPAMTPLPPSTLLSPNFCFSFPGILLFSLQICSPLSGTGDAKWIGLSSRFCAKHPQNQPKSLGPSPATSPWHLWVLWRAFLVSHQELQYRGCLRWAKLPLGHFSDPGGARGRRNNLDCSWFICPHCQCLGMMLNRQHSVPGQAHNKTLKLKKKKIESARKYLPVAIASFSLASVISQRKRNHWKWIQIINISHSSSLGSGGAGVKKTKGNLQSLNGSYDINPPSVDLRFFVI